MGVQSLGWDKLKKLLATALSWTGTQTFSTVDINGGAIDGTTIGAASAGAGSFTTVSASSSVSGSNANAGTVVSEAASGTNPTLIPDKTDLDTGIGRAAADSLSLVAGGVEGARFIENTGVIQINQVTAGITAATTQSQGQGALTSSVNEVATCANANDVVTLPSAVAGMFCEVINNGAQTLQIFPASSDNLGAGVNTSTTLTAGNNVVFRAYDNTNWEIVGGTVSALGTHASNHETGGSDEVDCTGLAGRINYVDRGDPDDADFTSFTTDGTWNDLDLSSIVPAGAVAVHLYVTVNDDAIDSAMSFRENGNSDTWNVSAIKTLVANTTSVGEVIVSCDGDRVIEYKGSNVTFTSINVVVRGWFI